VIGREELARAIAAVYAEVDQDCGTEPLPVRPHSAYLADELLPLIAKRDAEVAAKALRGAAEVLNANALSRARSHDSYEGLTAAAVQTSAGIVQRMAHRIEAGHE
jgi:hypothetical protein